MEEKKKTIKRKNSSVKSVKKPTTKLSSDELLEQIMLKKRIKKINKKPVSELTSDELLDQILDKKRTKKAAPKKSAAKKNVKKKVDLPLFDKQYVDKRLKEVNKKLKDKSISSDEIFDLINEKKKLTKELNRIKATEKKEVVKPPVKKPVKKVEEKPVKKTEEEPKPKVEEVEEKTTEELIEELTPEKKKELLPLFLFLLILALLVGFIVGAACYVKFHKNSVVINNVEEPTKEEDNKDEIEKLEKYNACLTRPFDDSDRTESVITAEKQLSDYLKKYRVSVGYKDINIGYTYDYNKDQVYYAASSVKVVTALYLYTEAAKGNINLDKTIKYTSKDRWSASKAMQSIKYGTNVKLRDLAKYAVTVSDNSAYQMLIKYLGKSNIKKFANNLGAKKTFVGGDNFGSINVSDGLIYWKAIYDFIGQDNKYAKEFKDYVMSADQNSLSLNEYAVQAAHKYGEYSPYYHDLGIMYSENPYLVVILTREFGKNMLTKVHDISKHVYELHLKYYENRETVCKQEVYEIEKESVNQ